jgi:molybdenum cofactor cytidylyltransferase
MHVAGILLAAGAATRMGRNKMLLELQGETLLRRAARRALAAGLDPVIAVLGHEAERAGAELAGLACRAVVNPRYARGMNTSLSAGVEALPPGTEAAVVVLADMPFVDAGLVQEVVARHRETGARVVTARYGQVPAPPTLYHRSLFPELCGGEGEGRGREVVRRHSGEAAFVDRPASALADVDQEDDFERARSRLASGGGT